MDLFEQEKKALTVTALVKIINNTLKAGELRVVVVEGEISQFKYHSSGHWYFTIKDESACLDCAMWRSANRNVLFRPKEGDKVRIIGELNVYNVSGKLSLIADSIVRSGEGELLEKFKALKAKLEREGLFDEDKKRPIPLAPRVIGIISGQSTAALSDAITRIKIRSSYSQIVVYPALVQGAEAVPSILKAIDRANSHKKADVLLLIRGGGSLEDLWCFNDENVARAIRASAIPIITGIGHSTDETIADFAADKRATTPTDAASLAAGDRQVLFAEVDKLLKQIQHCMDRKIADSENSVGSASYSFSSPAALLSPYRSELKEVVLNLIAGASSLTVNVQSKLSEMKIKIFHTVNRNYDLTFNEIKRNFQSEMHRLVDKKQQACLLSRPVNRVALQHYADTLQTAVTYLKSCQPKPVNTPVRQAVALLMTSTRRQITLNAERLGQAKMNLSRLAPEKILSMGYALVRRGGMQILSAKEVKVGDELDITFSDGTLKAKVEDQR